MEKRIEPGQKWAEKFGLAVVMVYDFGARDDEVFFFDVAKPDLRFFLPEDDFRADHELIEEDE